MSEGRSGGIAAEHVEIENGNLLEIGEVNGNLLER